MNAESHRGRPSKSAGARATRLEVLTPTDCTRVDRLRKLPRETCRPPFSPANKCLDPQTGEDNHPGLEISALTAWEHPLNRHGLLRLDAVVIKHRYLDQ